MENIYGPYFHASEFNSLTAPGHVKLNLLRLTKELLNPIREKFGPVKITSGYRSPEYNKELRKKGYNSADNSQHCTGEAVDLVCPASTSLEVYNWASENLTGKYGQLFYYKKKGHIHISLINEDLIKRNRVYAKILDQ